nr:probable protein phosphatase 2C 8 isoform X2 [Ipomoea batatas]
MKSDASLINEPKIEGNRESVCSKNGCTDANGSKQSFEIEANAAEDKGSRHTMEDAWVVLPDASNVTPGKLRGLARWCYSCLCLGIRTNSKVFVANIGDAKAVLARSSQSDGSTSLKAIVLTREHKAIYPQERARIQKAGGSVSSNGRLQGRLEVSRAFGDRQFKKVGVVATPDIHSFDLSERDHFIILGCDGLWGVFGPSDAVQFVQKLLKEGLPVSQVSRRLVREAVRERHCKDNCTAVLIVFKNG